MPDTEISRLPALAGTALQATDPLALADLSASETKRITAKELIQYGVALIDDGSIPSTKFNYTLPAGAVGTAQLAAGAVTADKLAANSTAVVGATATRVAGAFIGQLHYDNTTGKATIWDGGTWQEWKAAGSINLIHPDTTGIIRATVSQSGDEVTLAVEPADTTGARQVLIGPTAAAGPITARQLIGADLPLATNVSIGAVQVGGSGLRMNGNQAVLDNSITSTTGSGVYGVVEYSAEGLVTAGRALSPADLPPAAAGSLGAIQPGSQFSIGINGTLLHTNSVPAGTATKVRFDSAGHVTGVLPLSATDIPDLDASKLTSGTLTSGRLADRSVTAGKLADYSTALIQEAVPTAGVGSHPIGMIWLQESTGQVSVWNGNSWMKTGASTLFNRNLRYAGTYSPTTGLVNGVTQFGTAEGFKVNDPIPAADDKIAGVYFVATGSGSSPSVAGGVSFDPGDWLLCHGTTGGWVRIDTLSGVGGGGGVVVSNLDDLLDVTLTAPTQGDFLQLGSASQWTNVSVLDEGTWT